MIDSIVLHRGPLSSMARQTGTTFTWKCPQRSPILSMLSMHFFIITVSPHRTNANTFTSKSLVSQNLTPEYHCTCHPPHSLHGYALSIAIIHSGHVPHTDFHKCRRTNTCYGLLFQSAKVNSLRKAAVPNTYWLQRGGSAGRYPFFSSPYWAPTLPCHSR